MQATLTLDDDLVSALKDAARGSGLSFEEAVNRLLRAGLAVEEPPRKPRPYRVKPVSLGSPRPGIDLDKALQLADALEDEALGRKLGLSQ